jgi:hypothetical protein
MSTAQTRFRPRIWPAGRRVMSMSVATLRRADVSFYRGHPRALGTTSMGDADFYIAVATVAPLFVVAVGLSTDGFKGLFYTLLGLANENKIIAGLSTMFLGILTIVLATVCEIISLVALYKKGAAQSTRDLLLAAMIAYLLVSAMILLLLLVYFVIVKGDEAAADYHRDEAERLERIRLQGATSENSVEEADSQAD